MTYRTDCGCIASRPEPSSASRRWTTNAEFVAALAAWAADWAEVAATHTRSCPRSAYYEGQS